jgi:hypothetical protein
MRVECIGLLGQREIREFVCKFMGKGKTPDIIHHQRIEIIKKDALEIMGI